MRIARVLLFLLLAPGCGERNPTAKAKTLLDSDPGRARELLLEAIEKSPNDYEAHSLLASLDEKAGDLDAAADGYSRLLSLPGSHGNERAIEERLYSVLKAQAVKCLDAEAGCADVLKRAAGLEAKLKLPAAFANEKLFELESSELEALKSDGRYDEAIGKAREIAGLYIDRKRSAPFASQAAELEETAFRARASEAFEAKLLATMVREGVFELSTKAIVARADYEVPPDMDPASPEFQTTVERAACGALLPAVKAALSRVAQAAGASAAVDDLAAARALSAALETGKTASWVTPFDPAAAAAKRPDRMTFHCEVRVGLGAAVDVAWNIEKIAIAPKNKKN